MKTFNPSRPSYFLLIILFPVLLTFSSCPGPSSDPCESFRCSNGGTCEDGVCICACEFTGETCDDVRVPDRMILTRIIYRSIPFFMDSPLNMIPWDDEPSFERYPDVYLQICQSCAASEIGNGCVTETLENYSHSQFILEADETVALPCPFEFPEEEYNLFIRDQDGTRFDAENDVVMFFLRFAPYQPDKLQGEGPFDERVYRFDIKNASETLFISLYFEFEFDC